MTASPPMTRPITTPRRFGKYVLIRKLAEGGMAEIYLAKQLGAEGFERDVVIKCMLDHFTQSREFVSMFLDEARLAARLHHPNIVQITDLGVEDNRYFICMEYLAGEDLDAVIAAAHAKSQTVPVAIAARIMLSVLEGLEFAHGYQEQGQSVELVHRDISPSNVFVTYQGTVKVLDFGIAKASSRMTQTQPGLLKGKWGYMSPEQARGESIDARSDLFSLGVTFHELLTARRVFERDTEIGVLLALMDQTIPSPASLRPEIPPALDRIVMKALERRREDRYASAAAMRADLEEFLRVTPSVPGVSQLAHYLQGLFGQAEVARKTKVPSLIELEMQPAQRMPVDTGVFEKTLVRPSDPRGVPAVPGPAAPPADPDAAPVAASAPRVLPASPQVSVAPARGAGVSIALGAVGAVALLALGGGLVWSFMPRPIATPLPVVVAPPVPAPVAPPVAPVLPPPVVPVTPPEPAEPAVAEPVQQTPEPLNPKTKTGKQAKKPKPAFTSVTPELHKAMNSYKAKLLACAEQFRASLPDDGKLVLEITISAQGVVDSSRVSEPAAVDRQLASCLESSPQGATFPNPNGTPLKFQQPLRFNK